MQKYTIFQKLSSLFFFTLSNRGAVHALLSKILFNAMPPACRVVGGQNRKMAKPILGRGVGGAV